MARIRVLSDDELIKTLASKFSDADEKHRRLIVEWDACRAIYQSVNAATQGGFDTGLVTAALFQPQDSDQSPIAFEGLELIKANLFLHSKLCITDPIVTARARNQDPFSKRAAENAELYIPWMASHTGMQEIVEMGAYLNTVIFGTGITYFGWDPDGGEYPLDEIPENVEDLSKFDFKMEGDLELEDVNPYMFWIDANATIWSKAQHCFRARDIAIEEALFVFDKPEQQELLQSEYNNTGSDTQTMSKEKKKGTVRIYEYWEKGLPWNGMLGLRVFFMCPAAPKILARTAHPFRHRKLPFAVMTDVDIPDNPWGMSRMIYAHQCQKSIDMMMSLFLDNTSLFGGVRMMQAEGSMNEDSIDNNIAKVDYYNAATGQKPEYFRPVPVTSDIWRGYTLMKTSIDSLYGMNEFSQGQIPRELSSFAVQLALEMDDKYRIRLFNKKKQYLKDLYIQGIELTQQYMMADRRLSITGIEGWKDSEYLASSTQHGDYEILVDYGQYIPIDPAARKQQVLEFLKSGFYEKAGGNMTKIAKLMVDGSMLDVKDDFERAVKIQERETDKIISGQDVQVQKWDKDESHILAIDDFTNTETFRSLEPEIQEAIWAHGQAHTDALAQKMAQSGGGSPGGGAPAAGGPQAAAGGMPPAGPEASGGGVPPSPAGLGPKPAELGEGKGAGNPTPPSPALEGMNPGIPG